MKAKSAKTKFLKRLESLGISLDSITVEKGVQAMIEYYTEERTDGCEFDSDGDMLLVEWGTYDWGKGESFEVSIVRQLIETDEEESEPRQLNLRFTFPPKVGKSAKQGSSQWCESLEGIEDFREFVFNSVVLKKVGDENPESVELQFGRV